VDESRLSECLDRLHEQYAGLKNGSGERADEGRPRISVVLAVHVAENTETFIATIESVLANIGAPPLEIIVVLNGKVSTRELLDSGLYTISKRIGVRIITISYTEDERYRDIRRPQNISVPKQRGLQEARGDIVVVTDIDCIVCDKWIHAYAEAFERTPGLVAAYGPIQLYGTTGPTGRIMTWISTGVKMLKLLIMGVPPFQGGNHALKTEICGRVPHLYELSVRNNQEIPSNLKKYLHLSGSLTDLVGCVPDAVIATYFPKQTESLIEAMKWFLESAWRNIGNLRRIRRNIRVS